MWEEASEPYMSGTGGQGQWDVGLSRFAEIWSYQDKPPPFTFSL